MNGFIGLSIPPESAFVNGLDYDDQVKAAMEWHFNPKTGSKFWLDQVDSLGFDPRSAVQSARDLRRFPDLTDKLRTTRASDLVPRALAKKRRFSVYESGGTTGPPKRIIDSGYRSNLASWTRHRLTEHGVPASADWIHLGPTGPHVVAFDNARYAHMGNGLFHTIDLDSRWIKYLTRGKRFDEVDDYLDHVFEQTRDILETQPIRVLSTTPRLIEEICERPKLYETVREKVDAIVWAGTAFEAESRRQIESVYFPEATIVGVYGNSLMGAAPQRVPQRGDREMCVFDPYPETTRIELVDAERQTVDYGQRGRVRFDLVSEEMFLPSVLERDTGIRVEPQEGSFADGIAEVRPLASAGDSEVVEGVY